jgi:hypothetical protein
MVDERLPIRFRREDGEIGRILLLEEWYDKLAPLFEYFRTGAGIVGLSEYSEDLEPAFEFFRHLIAEFEIAGWAFTFSLIALLQWAAKQAITLGKFSYEHAGWSYDTMVYGSGTYGGEDNLEIREIPTEE